MHSPSSAPKLNQRQLIYLMATTSSVTFCVLLFSLGLVFFLPARRYEPLPVVLIASFFMSGLITYLLHDKIKAGLLTFLSGQKEKLVVVFQGYLILGWALGLAGLALIMNQTLDRAPATQIRTPVVHINTFRSRRSNSCGHAIYVAMPTPPQFPWIFEDQRHFILSTAEFDRLSPTAPEVSLAVHPGFFHLPWLTDVRAAP